MPRDNRIFSGWRGSALVAATYFYFLIFAQFGFISRLNSLAITSDHLKTDMAAMATGGILLSLLTPRLKVSAAVRLRLGLSLCATAAFLTLLRFSFAAAVALAFLIGCSLAILTVTLVTHLREWTGRNNPLLAAGIGTGAGYFACNIPWVFNASALAQACAAGAVCIAALLIPLESGPEPIAELRERPQSKGRFLPVLAAFTALIWLDSAAFFIIQNNPALKAGTWNGIAHLWSNGALHLFAAILSGWLLSRIETRAVLSIALVTLGGACMLLLPPVRLLAASVLYPIGVSLYSVALVAYPSLLTQGSVEQRAQRAAWLYAIAGWVGSAMGIGMAQNLGYVPRIFVSIAAAVILIPQCISFTRKVSREALLIGSVALSAALVSLLGGNSASSAKNDSQIERGRQVYISEGCIHCHSQYVRPNSADVLMWGPARSIDQVRQDLPPLIGNRRQGPDLSQIGMRRSPLWLSAHLFAPAEVSGASIMPPYGFLFRDRRGDDLVAYLASLRGADPAAQIGLQGSWSISDATWLQADTSEGEQLYKRYCATCHDAQGRTRTAWSATFRHAPTDLANGPYRTVQPGASPETQLTDLTRIVKFGIPGTDMPGHEYLPDRQVASMAMWTAKQMKSSQALLQNPTQVIDQEKNK